MAAGYRVAVVGATGAAGQATLKILEERKFPVAELRCFASERSIGKPVVFKGESLQIRRIEPAEFQGVDIAFGAAGAAPSRGLAPMIVPAGAVLVDKSDALPVDPRVPPRLPGINT